MAEFIVRVVLSLADSSDYEKLNKRMESFMFSRVITDDYGRRFYLPAAEYTIIRANTCYGIREQVIRIASAIKVNPQVLVTEVANRSWQLEKL